MAQQCIWSFDLILILGMAARGFRRVFRLVESLREPVFQNGIRGAPALGRSGPDYSPSVAKDRTIAIMQDVIEP
jgi:hypothetical protein